MGPYKNTGVFRLFVGSFARSSNAFFSARSHYIFLKFGMKIYIESAIKKSDESGFFYNKKNFSRKRLKGPKKHVFGNISRTLH